MNDGRTAIYHLFIRITVKDALITEEFEDKQDAPIPRIYKDYCYFVMRSKIHQDLANIHPASVHFSTVHKNFFLEFCIGGHRGGGGCSPHPWNQNPSSPCPLRNAIVRVFPLPLSNLHRQSTLRPSPWEESIFSRASREIYFCPFWAVMAVLRQFSPVFVTKIAFPWWKNSHHQSTPVLETLKFDYPHPWRPAIVRVLPPWWRIDPMPMYIVDVLVETFRGFHKIQNF